MKVVTMPLFYTNCYLIQTATGWILVDAGTRSQAKSFLRRLGKLGIQPSDIKLIIITHAHFDHVGSLASIKSLCNCPVLAHPLEARLIETGEVVIPPGTNALGKLVSWLGRHNTRLLRFPKTKVEFTTDQELDLTPMGWPPGSAHTRAYARSLSVLLEDGQAIVGDLARLRARQFPHICRTARKNNCQLGFADKTRGQHLLSRSRTKSACYSSARYREMMFRIN